MKRKWGGGGSGFRRPQYGGAWPRHFIEHKNLLLLRIWTTSRYFVQQDILNFDLLENRVVIKWQIYQSQIFKLTNSLFVLPNLKHLELVHSTLFLKLIQFKKTNLFFFLSRTVAENPKHSTQSTSWSLIWEFIPRKSHICVR